MDLGDVPVGTTAEAYAVLTNGPFFPDRIAPLTVGAISVEGTDLWVDEGCEGHVLNQAGSCAIRISWAPATAGALDGRLVVTSDAPASPTSVAIVGVAIP